MKKQNVLLLKKLLQPFFNAQEGVWRHFIILRSVCGSVLLTLRIISRYLITEID